MPNLNRWAQQRKLSSDIAQVWRNIDALKCYPFPDPIDGRCVGVHDGDYFVASTGGITRYDGDGTLLWSYGGLELGSVTSVQFCEDSATGTMMVVVANSGIEWSSGGPVYNNDASYIYALYIEGASDGTLAWEHWVGDDGFIPTSDWVTAGMPDTPRLVAHLYSDGSRLWGLGSFTAFGTTSSMIIEIDPTDGTPMGSPKGPGALAYDAGYGLYGVNAEEMLVVLDSELVSGVQKYVLRFYDWDTGAVISGDPSHIWYKHDTDRVVSGGMYAATYANFSGLRYQLGTSNPFVYLYWWDSVAETVKRDKIELISGSGPVLDEDGLVPDLVLHGIGFPEDAYEGFGMYVGGPDDFGELLPGGQHSSGIADPAGTVYVQKPKPTTRGTVNFQIVEDGTDKTLWRLSRDAKTLGFYVEKYTVTDDDPAVGDFTLAFVDDWKLPDPTPKLLDWYNSEKRPYYGHFAVAHIPEGEDPEEDPARDCIFIMEKCWRTVHKADWKTVVREFAIPTSGTDLTHVRDLTPDSGQSAQQVVPTGLTAYGQYLYIGTQENPDTYSGGSGAVLRKCWYKWDADAASYAWSKYSADGGGFRGDVCLTSSALYGLYYDPTTDRRYVLEYDDSDGSHGGTVPLDSRVVRFGSGLAYMLAMSESDLIGHSAWPYSQTISGHTGTCVWEKRTPGTAPSFGTLAETWDSNQPSGTPVGRVQHVGSHLYYCRVGRLYRMATGEGHAVEVGEPFEYAVPAHANGTSVEVYRGALASYTVENDGDAGVVFPPLDCFTPERDPNIRCFAGFIADLRAEIESVCASWCRIEGERWHIDGEDLNNLVWVAFYSSGLADNFGIASSDEYDWHNGDAELYGGSALTKDSDIGELWYCVGWLLLSMKQGYLAKPWD